MSLKKKLAITTLAVSLSAASFTGLPLSENGLMEKLKLSGVAYAASAVPDTSDAFKSKLEQIEAKIGSLFPSSNAGADARASLHAANHSSISGIMGTLNGKIAGSPDYPDIDASKVGLLFKSLISLTLADADKIDDLKLAASRATIQQLGELAGEGTLTYNDFVVFATALETNIKNGFNLSTLESTNGYVTLVTDKLKDLIDADNTKFANVLNALGITADEVNDAIRGYTDQIPEYNGALKQVVFANASLEAVLDPTSSDNGRVWTPTLKFAGISLGSSFVTWTLSGGSGLMKIENNKIVFNGAGSDTVTLQGSINLEGSSLHGLPIYSGSFSATYSPPGTFPITGGSGTGGTETPSAPTIDDVLNELDKAADEIENAAPEEKAKLLDELLNKSQKALDDAAKLDVSQALTTDGDKSTAALDTESVIKLLEDIQQIANELHNKLAALGVEAPLKLTLLIDLGTVSTSTGEVEINKDILKAAQDLGFTNAAVAVNGVSVSLPIASFSEDVALAITTDKDAVLGSTTSNEQVSDVIDFNLSVGGQAVTSFEQPIEIRIALRNLAGVDKDLLSVARITDGQVEYYGGQVVDNELVELRDRFSSYVVVENKVEFDDVAKVQSWAGRQIQVVAAKGAVEGKAKGKFAPSDLITRAEFAKMLTRALDLDNVLAKSKFSDVQDGHWSAAYVAAAADLGIIQGRKPTAFAPTDTITRAEMATMIARAMKVTHNLKDVENEDAIVASFLDAADIPSSLKAGVAFAADNNIVIGNAGKFSPNANATRAEAAVILYRAINYSK